MWSASLEGFNPSRSNRARIKLSIPLRGQSASFTFGGAKGLGVSYAQCLPHLAPASIHSLSVAFCAAVSFRFDSGGGMSSSASFEKMRAMISLSALLPGTMTSRLASASTSKRSLALRALASGPWQVKQVSERIGKTSRLKSGAANTLQATENTAMEIQHRIAGSLRLTRRLASQQNS